MQNLQSKQQQSKTIYLETLKNNPVKYAHLFGFDKLTDIHNEWIQQFLSSTTDYTLQAHRGSYKTTCLTVALALLVVFRPDQNHIVLRKTDSDIKEVIGGVKKILKSDAMAGIVYDLYGTEINFLAESVTEIKTNLFSKPSDSAQVLGLGIGSSLTGKHADRIFTDDIVNLTDRISRAERVRTRSIYMELENIRNPDGVIGNTGTPWHKDDAFEIMPKAVKYDWRTTKLFDDDEINQRRQAMTPSLFAANYELKHIASEDSLFDKPQFADETMLDILKSGYATSHIDASYGGADSTALTVAVQDAGRIIVHGKLYRGHVDKHIYNIKAVYDDYLAGTMYAETNADKGYLSKSLRDLGIICQNYHEKQNKYIKISSILRKNWNSIYFTKDTDPEYLDQILDFNENAAHDDAPDSLASLIRQFEKTAILI